MKTPTQNENNLLDIWNMEDDIPADPQLVASELQHLHRLMGISRRRRVSVWTWAAAIAIVLAMPALYFAGHDAGKKSTEPLLAGITQEKELLESVTWLELKTPAGGTDTLLLSDGTVLYLNSGSRVTYPDRFAGNSRQVFVDGEVYAEVAKDPQRPFTISSGDATVQVLGTTFNFKSYCNSRCVECLLLEGAVRMEFTSDTGDREVLMSPGNLVQFDRLTGEVSISDFQSKSFKPFKDGGAMHFFNITLDDIASDLERAFGVRIMVMDEALASTRIFAIFNNNESLDTILSELNSDSKMKIRRREGVVYLSSASI